MIFEGTRISSVYNPYPIYFRTAVNRHSSRVSMMLHTWRLMGLSNIVPLRITTIIVGITYVRPLRETIK